MSDSRRPFRVIFDIGHPGHVHLFKNLAKLLLADGAEVLFTLREKEFEKELVEKEGFPYENFGRHYRTFIGKIWGLVKYDLRMIRTCLRFRPDLIIGNGSIYGAHAAAVVGTKCLAFEDTGNMEQVRLYRPFTDAIITPDVLGRTLGPKQSLYDSSHEMAYLHPEFFRPDPGVLDWLGVGPDEPFAIIRFISWDASHDIGHKGLSRQEKLAMVRELTKRMRVFITSEGALTEDLKPYCLKIPPDRFHDALHYASLVITEGTTTGAEACILGTPVVYVGTYTCMHLRQLEEFGLARNTLTAAAAGKAVEGILEQDRLSFRERAKVFVEARVNSTRYYHDFIRQRYMGADRGREGG